MRIFLFIPMLLLFVSTSNAGGCRSGSKCFNANAALGDSLQNLVDQQVGNQPCRLVADAKDGAYEGSELYHVELPASCQGQTKRAICVGPVILKCGEVDAAGQVACEAGLHDCGTYAQCAGINALKMDLKLVRTETSAVPKGLPKAGVQ